MPPRRPTDVPRTVRRGRQRRGAPTVSGRPITRAAADRLLADVAICLPGALAPGLVATHRQILADGGQSHRWWEVHPAGIAILAAVELDGAANLLLPAPPADASRPIDAGRTRRVAPIERARSAVALSAGWAWCALLGQCEDANAVERWVVRTCWSTQHAIARRDPASDTWLADAVAYASRALARAAARSSPESHPGSLSQPLLAAAIGTLGATHDLLGVAG